MNEWIIAPLLAVDPTGLPTYRQEGTTDAGGNRSQQREDGLEEQGERRGGERREDHAGERDDDFGRGEDRRGDVL